MLKSHVNHFRILRLRRTKEDLLGLRIPIRRVIEGSLPSSNVLVASKHDVTLLLKWCTPIFQRARQSRMSIFLCLCKLFEIAEDQKAKAKRRKAAVRCFSSVTNLKYTQFKSSLGLGRCNIVALTAAEIPSRQEDKLPCSN